MYRVINPLILDPESGEVLYAGYRPWWFPEDNWRGTTPSQQAFLATNAQLCADDIITEGQAKFNEANFVLYGWQWADMPQRNRHNRRLSTELLEELQAKKP